MFDAAVSVSMMVKTPIILSPTKADLVNHCHRSNTCSTPFLQS